jgi:hypothetical protein
MAMTVIVDGQRQRGYDWIVNGMVGFTADSKRVVYAARKRRKAVMVVDGKEGAVYDSISRWMVAERGGDVMWSANSGGAAHAVFNGVAGPAFEFVHLQSFVDQRLYAYVAEKSGRQMAVTHGSVSKPWEKVVGMRLSADGKRFAYCALEEGKWRMVSESGEGEPFDAMSAAEFSADGKRVGYTAVRGGESLCVIDGETTIYPGALSNLQLSADGSRHLLISTMNEIDRLVVDGKEVARHGSIPTARFSADGRQVAHVGRGEKNELRTVFVDGKSVGVFDEMLSLTAAPGGGFVVVGQRNGRYFVLVDGREMGPYDFVFTRHPPAFLEDGSIRFLAMKGRQIVQVTGERSSTKAPT